MLGAGPKQNAASGGGTPEKKRGGKLYFWFGALLRSEDPEKVCAVHCNIVRRAAHPKRGVKLPAAGSVVPPVTEMANCRHRIAKMLILLHRSILNAMLVKNGIPPVEGRVVRKIASCVNLLIRTGHMIYNCGDLHGHSIWH